MLNKIDWSYWAGFFDGEGCISVGHNGGSHWALRITLSCCNKEVIDKFHNLFRGSVYDQQYYKNQHRNCYRARLSGLNAISFLKGIYSYSIVKKDEVAEALKFPVGKSGCSVSKKDMKLRYNIKQKLHDLKKVGVI
jgi:hypothetical protein